MYDRDTIELALLALEEGMSQGEAAELAGVARTTVGNWERGRLPHARSEKRAHRLTRPPQRAARMLLALPQNQPNAPLYPAGGAPGSRPGALPHFGRPRYLGPPPRARSTAG